jgi:hypothetical protein
LIFTPTRNLVVRRIAQRKPDSTIGSPSRAAIALVRFDVEATSRALTYLREGRDDRAVEEAFQEQQIRVVGDLAQLADIVTYMHERGWNSNGALHNWLRVPMSETTIGPPHAVGDGCERVAREKEGMPTGCSDARVNPGVAIF